MMTYSFLPHLNAILNATAILLLVGGYYLIRRGRPQAHRAFMLGATAVSTLFLISYLTFHLHAGAVHFLKRGWVRPVYFSILITHTVLAAAIPPLVLITLWRALGRRFDKHRRIARWTLPLWIYVSATGVLVYLMLYQWQP
jgi:putative membrane protein